MPEDPVKKPSQPYQTISSRITGQSKPGVFDDELRLFKKLSSPILYNCPRSQKRTNERESLSPLVQAGIGAFAASADLAVNQPLDTMKTLAQSGKKIKFPRSLAKYFQPKNYAGVVAHAWGHLPANGAMFLVKSVLDSIMPDIPEPIKGGLAGIVIAPIYNLAERGKIYKQTLAPEMKVSTPYPTIYRGIYRTGGIKGIFKGTAPGTLRDSKWGAGIFGANHVGEYVFSEEVYEKHPSLCLWSTKLPTCFLLAAASNPDDVVKTQMLKHKSIYKNAARAVIGIYRKDGLAGFCKGGKLRTLRIASGMVAGSTVAHEVEKTIFGLS